MQILKYYLLLSALLFSIPTIASDREDTLCGWAKERLGFKIWSTLAGRAKPKRVAGIKHIEPVQFATSDNKILRGYKYNSHNSNDIATNPKGYILMALGNGGLADKTISRFKNFSLAGYDMYIFNYRGYGDSSGKRRIKAMIEDYQELVAHLNHQYPEGKHLLYGTSFGGVVLANIIGRGISYDKAVIDSSPSRLSGYGCKKFIDPAENVPEDASRILVITGELEQTLPVKTLWEYRELARKNGASVYHGLDYAHIYHDKTRAVRNERYQRALNFLDQD